MQWSSKGQSASSFARLIGFKTESFRSIYLPVEYFGQQKVPNKCFSMQYEPHINEPKGRTIRKVMGGGGEKTKKKFMQGKMSRKKIRAKKKVKKKNSCRRKVQPQALLYNNK